MEITTLTCANCGTIVAENILEKERIMKCPNLGCQEILSFKHIQKSTADEIK